jgi:8-oxo-dGTP pyrophosphatase MutT (NUDIX family)
MQSADRPEVTLNKLRTWRVLNTSIALQTPWFKISRNRAVTPMSIEVDYYIHHASDSVLCVCVRDDGLLLVEEQYRLPVDRRSIDYPGGRIEADDTSTHEAISREIEEETGYRIAALKKLGEIDKDPGFSTSKVHIYLAQGLLPGNHHLDATEDIVARLVEPSQVLGMIEDGSMTCAFCVSATFLAFRELQWLSFDPRRTLPPGGPGTAPAGPASTLRSRRRGGIAP